MSIAEKLVTVAENQQKVYDAGYAKGQAEGGDTDAAYNDGYEAGQQAEYDVFWDVFQVEGNRSEYNYTFFFWEDACYKPKYIPKPTKATNMYGFSNIKEITVDLTIATSSLTNTFANSTTLKKLTVYSSQNTAWATTTFTNTTTITDLTIIGTIGKSITINTLIDITHDSLMSVINALKDYSGSTTTYKLTMGNGNLAKLTDAEKAIATEKGWTLA